MKLLAQLTLMFLLVATFTANLQALTLDVNKENVVASRLEGSWKVDDKLSQKLTGEANKFDISFKVDLNVARKIPKRFDKFFADKKVFLAGYMKLKGKKYPFLLSNIYGNPHVFYFRPKGGRPMGDAESFNLFVARAEKAEQDILLIGGDFNNCPFMALKRVPENGEKLMTIRGYLPSFQMQHPLIYDNQTYFDRYNSKGEMVSQKIVVYDDGLRPPSDRNRPIEIKGIPEKVSLGGRPGTKGSYSNTIIKVSSWKYLKKSELPKK